MGTNQRSNGEVSPDDSNSVGVAPAQMGSWESWILRPGSNTRFLGSGNWIANDDDPQFNILPQFSELKPGVYDIEIVSSKSSETPIRPLIYFDVGRGYNEADAQQLPTILNRSQFRIIVPKNIRSIRLDPIAQAGKFTLHAINVRRLSSLEIVSTINRKKAGRRNALATLISQGAAQAYSLYNDDQKHEEDDYDIWLSRYQPSRSSVSVKIREHLSTLEVQPLISIVTPVYNSNIDWLRQAIQSVQDQVYENWELCIVDDASPDSAPFALLKELAATDPRIKPMRLAQNGGISAATNAALTMASGEWISFMDHDDTIQYDALALVVDKIANTPKARIIYTDEDKINETGKRFDPYFKGGWNRELFYGQNYLNHLTTVRRDVVKAAGPLRPELDGSQDYDFLLRCIEQVDNEAIVHLPFICYHWRFATQRVNFSQTFGDRSFQAGLTALNEHFERTKQNATAERAGPDLNYSRAKWKLSSPPPKISIIIPTRDRKSILETAISSIREKTTYPNYEILIADNDSEERETLEYFKELEARGHARIIPTPGPFNFSRINNIAAREATGEILAFVNNDVEVRNDDWLDEMASHFARPDVGAVGAKLYYPDGSIQHAGVVTGIGGVAGHIYKSYSGNAPGPFSLLRLPRETTCATAACLLVRKDLFWSLSGFDEKNLAVAFNDVDLCLKIRREGAIIIWTPYSQLTHFESVSRGADTDPDKQARFQQEVRSMWASWPQEWLERDPYYSPNLTLNEENAALAHPPRAKRPWE